jgi:hypothetical protein
MSNRIIDIRERENIGRSRYVVSWHVPGKTHQDGSPFYDIAIFRNRRVKDQFVQKLRRFV